MTDRTTNQLLATILNRIDAIYDWIKVTDDHLQAIDQAINVYSVLYSTLENTVSEMDSMLALMYDDAEDRPSVKD